MSEAPDLDTALLLCAASLACARDVGALVSVAVVDGGGNLVAFVRMDGAEIAGPTLAVDKAYTAVAHRVATDVLGVLAGPGGPLQGLASAAGGRYVCFGGGKPLWSGGRVVGGVGVSGGTVEQDVACAKAAADKWPYSAPTDSAP
ncbi:GlcG/HbpS family heme-binding protein [Cryptosporangium minutisporangium]|uniref:Heme-binding protein n=1 Tax=Cryptosporangium minutisporangium TaxID=113569 RepID=A0ABP6SUS2_9ACTN